jgi:predicted SnoaL-like aldol condensation-catalyzing enzyme
MNEFVYLLYSKKNVKAAFDKYVVTNYVQHNPDIAGGKAAAIKAPTPLFSAKGNTFEARNRNTQVRLC